MFRFEIDSMINGIYTVTECEKLTRDMFRIICQEMVDCMRESNYYMCYCTIKYNGKEKTMGLIAHEVRNRNMYFVYYKGIMVYREEINPSRTKYINY